MKTLLSSIAILSCFALNLYAGPLLVCEEPVHDFGNISDEAAVTHAYTITNGGDEPLNVTKAKASCGCTTPKFAPGILAPGESMDISVSFNPARRFGKQSKTVTISSNCSTKPSYQVRFSAKVLSALTITPTGVSLGNVGVGQTVTKVVKLTNNSETPMEITEAKGTGKFLDVKIRTITEGKAWELDVSNLPGAAAGRINDRVRIKYTGEKPGERYVSVFGSMVAPISIPANIAVKQGDTSTSFIIKGGSTTNFELLDVKWPGVTATRKIVNNGINGFNVTFDGLTVTPALNTQPIVVMTTVPGYESHQIPVTVAPVAAAPAAAPVAP